MHLNLRSEIRTIVWTTDVRTFLRSSEVRTPFKLQNVLMFADLLFSFLSRLGKIRPDTADEFREEFLYVPPIPPTNLRNCRLILIEYFVMVRDSFFFSLCSHCSQVQRIHQQLEWSCISAATWSDQLGRTCYDADEYTVAYWRVTCFKSVQVTTRPISRLVRHNASWGLCTRVPPQLVNRTSSYKLRSLTS